MYTIICMYKTHTIYTRIDSMYIKLLKYSMIIYVLNILWIDITIFELHNSFTSLNLECFVDNTWVAQ